MTPSRQNHPQKKKKNFTYLSVYFTFNEHDDFNNSTEISAKLMQKIMGHEISCKFVNGKNRTKGMKIIRVFVKTEKNP